jgi:protease IV
MKAISSLFQAVIRLFSFLLFKIEHFFLFRSPYNTVELTISGRIVESTMPLQRFMRPRKKTTSILDLLSLLQFLAADNKVKTVVLRIAPVGAGWSQVQTIARGLTELNEAGKKTIAFFERGGNREYYLAAHCSKIVAPPSTVVNLVGLMIEIVFFKELVDKLAIHPDLYAEGKYKSAIEAVTRKSSSRPAKEMTEGLVDGLYQQLVQGIAAARSIDESQVEKLIDGGPYTGMQAKEAGLIDSAGYYEEIVAELKKDKPLHRVSGTRYLRAWSSMTENRIRYENKGSIAIVLVQGTITDGRAKSGGAGSRTLISNLRKVARNKNIKAVVLRVSSPGGSSLASDLIWRAIGELKKKKPVIASMGDTAASGGYYVAMAADEVLVEPGTITGSIGVITGKMSFRGLYKKLGLLKEQFRRGDAAGIFSDYSPFSESEKKKIIGLMRQFYADFVGKVAVSRGMPVEEIEKLAQGRVYLGSEAIENGLVDKQGSLPDAIAIAKTRVGLPTNEPIELDLYPKPATIWKQLLSGLPASALPESLDSVLSDFGELVTLEQGPQYRLPILFRID